MKVLFILPFNPTIPNTGNKNLTHALLNYMNQHISCDVFILAEEDEKKSEAEIRRAFPNVGSVKIFSKPQGLQKTIARLKFLSSSLHPSFGNFASKELREWLRKACRDKKYDLVHFDMFHTAQYLSEIKNMPALLVGSDAYSMAAKNSIVQERQILRKLKLVAEEFLFRQMERSIYPNFDTVCLVSNTDLDYLSNISRRSNLRCVKIAVSNEFTNRPLNRLSNLARSTPRILLTGSLAHPIVAQGAMEFVEQVLPKVRQKHPTLPIVVLGKDAPQKLTRAISSLKNAEYINFVDDYAKFLDDDWIYVHPQKCGSGLQTKIQQALALGLPVLGYPVSFGGLNLTNKLHAFICEDENALALQISNLLQDHRLRERIGTAAAQYVRAEFSIEKMGVQFMELYHELA